MPPLSFFQEATHIYNEIPDIFIPTFNFDVRPLSKYLRQAVRCPLGFYHHPQMLTELQQVALIENGVNFKCDHNHLILCH